MYIYKTRYTQLKLSRYQKLPLKNNSKKLKYNIKNIQKQEKIHLINTNAIFALDLMMTCFINQDMKKPANRKINFKIIMMMMMN